jgi:asparagine synthase (glutamine-hydrolysing)
MCGISGYVSLQQKPEFSKIHDEILSYQTKRGPDFCARLELIVGEVTVSLGHNRLSIIDLADNANQPMESYDGSLNIVFNGEIYNYLEIKQTLINHGKIFKTKSDTEVILEAFKFWGESCFNMFFGMFSFALTDKENGKIYLVRDRFGVKPLYYYYSDSVLFFASSAKKIADNFNCIPNLNYLSQGLLFKYYESDSNDTQYESIFQVFPSSYIKIDCRNSKKILISEHKYYDIRIATFTEVDRIKNFSYSQLLEETEHLLLSACNLRLRSDVPVGISISGGLDSSTIACLLSQNNISIDAFSFSKPDIQSSEGPLVKKLSDKLGLRTHYCWWIDSNNIENAFWKTLNDQDAPFPSTSVIAQNEIFRIVNQQNIKVLLGGQGGDEAFMGYRKFYLFYLLDCFRNNPLNVIPYLFRDVIPLLPSIVKRGNVFLSERSRFTNTESGMGTRLSLPKLEHKINMGLEKEMSLKERQILDITKFSLPTLLRYEDRNSMGNSVESRLPFLDHRLIEFGIAISEQYKVRNGFGKWIIRDAMKGKLINNIRLNRDKRGFDVNQDYCIKNGIGSLIRNYLLDNKSRLSNYINKESKIEILFSNDELISNPQAFKEAVSLIWLVKD